VKSDEKIRVTMWNGLENKRSYGGKMIPQILADEMIRGNNLIL
tara:strand:- start:990 stop:1118 length:129 start_codon:yes stop_codon:yes gene_type:complete